MIFFFKIENLLLIASNELRKPMKGTELICTLNEKNIAECIQIYVHITSFTLRVNSFMQSLLQRVSFYHHCSSDVNKDKMIPFAAMTA